MSVYDEYYYCAECDVEIEAQELEGNCCPYCETEIEKDADT